MTEAPDAIPARLVPDGFAIPHPPVTADFTFEPLGPEHNEADLAAWTGSLAHIQQTPGFVGRSWPVRVFTLAENLKDLQMHAADFAARTGFTWTVLDPRSGETIGCVYVYPDKAGEADVHASSWVIASRAALDAPLYRHILGWLHAQWPFERIRYAER